MRSDEPGGLNRRRMLAGVAAGSFCALVTRSPARAACAIFPPDGAREFLILRHNQVVGRHDIAFSRPKPAISAARADAIFVVRSDIEIRAGLLGTDEFRFVHRAEETWRDGWLDALVSDTEDDGRRRRVRAERRDGVFSGVSNSLKFTVSGYIIPSSLWHHDTVAVEALLDTTDGIVKVIRARDLGEEQIPRGGGRVTARHYALEGQIQHQLWYDGDCRLVRAAFLARDGSWLTLEEG